MAWLSILDRFRPVGAPGSAGIAGVPADDDQGPARELAPVFAELAPDLAAAAELLEGARRDAADLVASAATRAAAIVVHARLEADAERAAAATRVTKRAARRDTRLAADAGRRAEALSSAAASDTETVVHRVINKLLADQWIA